MRGLSLTTGFIFILILIFAFQTKDSPHGEDFDMSCKLCHSPDSWKLNQENMDFDHASTSFPLEGQHVLTGCRECHVSLVFSQTPSQCVACHTDMHEQTLGMDCGRCHTPQSWIVPNITEIHQLSRFPLVGAHLTAGCSDCHPSASSLRFAPLGIECIECHQQEYLDADNPNHVEADFSVNCQECHNVNAFDWSGAGFNHAFFPLTKGHDIANCFECHTPGSDYSEISANCYSCHETDYVNAANPAHQQAGFSTECQQCHTTDPGWKPASFQEHDGLYFPIYSGEHQGEWGTCMECHTDPNDYTLFSCIDCHEHNKPDTDEEHDDVGGYIYESQACYQCHPTGSAEDGFDHSQTQFPLTGAHITTACVDCHADGYEGTPMQCVACHEEDYGQTTNPNHQSIGLSTECQNCHTTNPGWQPATFDEHDGLYFPIYSGEHNGTWNECLECHTDPSNYNLFTCIDCHEHNKPDTDEEHDEVGGYIYESIACYECHPDGTAENSFDHNQSAFPLTGAHITTACIECHASGYTGTPTECFACHEPDFNQSTNPDHAELGLSTSCADCHSTQPGWQPASFDIHDQFHVLEGAHAQIANNCALCHDGNYISTPNTCVGCHQEDYNQTSDPPHLSAQFPTDCEMCHSQSAWKPSTFDHDGMYFPIYSGSHNGEWGACIDCHTNPSNYTVFSCIDCHEHNQQDMDEDHDEVPGYIYESNACFECHPNGEEPFGKLRKVKDINNERAF
ncbi:MAG: hypothetical protein K9G67_00885 [Bacteroidales bacterium]|nr:hypothetical protein [Bacteroidales bacterium]MCF8351936.1 hypothetical protein [Bacteroidales bacterium]MCF8374887.1 hypothetical protein [Bacteroidales bacterium]MCF8400134.1 hypothetical protein [Bacteroidales bacterium]